MDNYRIALYSRLARASLDLARAYRTRDWSRLSNVSTRAANANVAHASHLAEAARWRALLVTMRAAR